MKPEIYTPFEAEAYEQGCNDGYNKAKKEMLEKIDKQERKMLREIRKWYGGSEELKVQVKFIKRQFKELKKRTGG